ncbi:hypothetical protein [Nocardia sp. NPDC052112]|uniref:hypothetical protein n=1 Tax=Nocardia sp. NPDC052112 TaxID=3155646 RepID=UPI0034275F77
MVTIIGGGIAGTVLDERRSVVDGSAFLTLDGRAHAALGELGLDRADLDAAS